MKKIITIFILFFTFILFANNVVAQDADTILKEQYENSGANEITKEIPTNIKEDLYNIADGQVNVENAGQLLDFKRVFQFVIDKMATIFKSEAKLFVTVILIIFIYLIFKMLFGSFNNKSFESIVNITITICLIGAIFNSLIECTNSAINSINDISTFSKSLIPIMCGLMVAGGQPVSASIFDALLFIACEICTYISVGLILPLVNVYIGLIIAQSININVKLNNFTGFIKSAVNWMIGIVFTVFIGLMSLQSLISGAADTVTKRTVKFAIGSIIPVAGGIFGDAMETIFSCANSVKSLSGVFGIIIIALIIITPLLTIFSKYIIFKLLALFSELMGANRFSSIISNFAGAFGILASLTLGSSILLISSFTIVLMSGVGK